MFVIKIIKLSGLLPVAPPEENKGLMSCDFV